VSDVRWKFLEPGERRGIIRISGTRMMILGAEYISTMMNELEKIIGYSATRGLVYRMFKEGAAQRIKKLYLYGGADLERTFVERIVPFMIELGWVTDAVLKRASDSKFYVEVSDSVFSDSEKGSTEPRCHPLAGVLAGIWSSMQGEDYDCTEVGCSAMNEDRCTFQVVPMRLTRQALAGRVWTGSAVAPRLEEV